MSRPIKFARRFGRILGSIDVDQFYPAYHFIYAIVIFALENNAAFNSLFKDKNKLAIVHFIRMQVDCCLEVYACLLYRDKDKFFKFFMDGKPINKLTIGKQQLTSGYLCGELDRRYLGIAEIYKEGCKWIHPNKVIFRHTAPVMTSNNYIFIGYKGREYTDDNEQLKAIYKDMLQVNQILHELLQELLALYKKKHAENRIIVRFTKTKRRIGWKRYE